MTDTVLSVENDSSSEATEQGQIEQRTRRMTLNMGPQHPSTHGVLRVLLELEGETIQNAIPDIGFLHTGIEKQCEALNWQQVVTLTDRVDYLSNLNNNLAYVLAVEKLLQIEIPPRAQYMRVMLSELSRISSHLVWLGTHALDIGAMSMFMYCFREREELLKIFEYFSGQRLMTSYFRVGGLALDAPRGWEKIVGKFLAEFPSRVDQYVELLDANPIWTSRTKGIGYIDPQRMIDIGISGPLIRATGLAHDLRKMEPYSGYDKFDFKVCTQTEGDVYARYQVRMAEFRQSMKIIRQAMEGMPGGPVTATAPKVVLPDREKMKTQMESLIYHFKIVTEGFSVPEGEAYVGIESPRGELGYYVVSDGSGKPLRVHMRTPSFGNIQGLPALIEGRLIADSIAIMGSLDFVLGDCDR